MKLKFSLFGLLILVIMANALGCNAVKRQINSPISDKSTLYTKFQEGDADFSPGTLGPGDVFEIRVYLEPELSGLYRVDPDGTITFPLLGRVPVLGQTPADVADLLRRKLGEGYLKNPHVSLFVKESNSKKVYVFGQVQKPGTFGFEQGMNIIQVITLAGGFTQLAAKDRTSITRVVEGKEIRVNVAVEQIGEGKEKNISVQPGDIIFVPESFF